MGVDDLEGVMVTSVDSESAAWEAGLREDGVILEVNQKRVRNLEDYRSAIADVSSGSVISLRVAAPGRRQGELISQYIFFRAP
jgi:S1-C subfamily serine protease